jgi:hypothetical protein
MFDAAAKAIAPQAKVKKLRVQDQCRSGRKHVTSALARKFAQLPQH